jgi:hypothetical protein
MSDQKELVNLILSHDAGKQVPLESLSSLLESFLVDRKGLSALQQKGETLLAQVEGSISHTWDPLCSLIESNSFLKE